MRTIGADEDPGAPSRLHQATFSSDIKTVGGFASVFSMSVTRDVMKPFVIFVVFVVS